MGLFADLLGTLKATFQVGLGGVKLKNSSGNLSVRNPGDSADAEITASKVNISGDSIELNSDASASGSDWKYILRRPSSGMTENVTLTFPPDNGSPGQVLASDGNGNLTFVSAGSTEALVHVDVTPVAYNSTSPVTMFTLPADAVVHKVEVVLDTPFNGTSPSMSVGITGESSKYMGATDVDLKGNAEDLYVVHPAKSPSSSQEGLVCTLNADGSTEGNARVLVYYSTPA